MCDCALGSIESHPVAEAQKRTKLAFRKFAGLRLSLRSALRRLRAFSAALGPFAGRSKA